ncbi:cupin domain-containing protein [Segetibacter koreensis]|uniref:cupin domain-containing protein n=1 Tax=Segetibacter koreensis TaxID=398037 RepID=UPI00037099C2|nr:cupin domain-containing protein [Segetibacter koreensis]
MENKSNEATPQRPEGDRVLDAALVTMDLNHLMEQVRKESSWKDSDRNSITIFKSDNMRVVLIGLHSGAELKTHTANGIISVQVLEGLIKFTTEQNTVELQKGQMLTLHKKIPHGVVALKETFFLLTMAIA